MANNSLRFSYRPSALFQYLPMSGRLSKLKKLVVQKVGFKMELRFLRDTDKREVDFVVIKNKKPVFAVECKSGESKVSPRLKYFNERTSIPHFYQVHLGKRHQQVNDQISLMPFVDFCKHMKLV